MRQEKATRPGPGRAATSGRGHRHSCLYRSFEHADEGLRKGFTFGPEILPGGECRGPQVRGRGGREPPPPACAGPWPFLCWSRAGASRDYGDKRARNKRIGPGGGTRRLHQDLRWGTLGPKQDRRTCKGDCLRPVSYHRHRCKSHSCQRQPCSGGSGCVSSSGDRNQSPGAQQRSGGVRRHLATEACTLFLSCACAARSAVRHVPARAPARLSPRCRRRAAARSGSRYPSVRRPSPARPCRTGRRAP